MNDYTGWNRPMKVTLLSTSNPYLQDQVPLVGLLTVHEVRTDGIAQPTRITFQRIDDEGKPVSTPVHVDDAEWTTTAARVEPEPRFTVEPPNGFGKYEIRDNLTGRKISGLSPNLTHAEKRVQDLNAHHRLTARRGN